MPTIPPLVITDEERAELQRRVRAHTTPQRAARRARIVLLAADGVPNRQIAPMVGMNEHTVAQWRRRFQSERLAGLTDRKRPGRPLVYDHDQRLRIVATVTQQPPDPASHWSHSQLAKALADMGISASQIGRILADLDIKPHRVRSWITRPNDPGFWERAADICGLYLVPPTNALVLSVDEKTGMPARSRTRPTTRPVPGRVARQEHEYVRHGTAILLAALDVHGGGIVQATDLDRNTAANFISFLDDLDAKVPAALAVLQAGQAVGLEAVPPLRDGVLVHAHHGSDLAVGDAISGQQHDPGPPGGPLWGGVGTDPALQLGALGVGDPKRWHGRHPAAPHAASLRSPPYVRN